MSLDAETTTTPANTGTVVPGESAGQQTADTSPHTPSDQADIGDTEQRARAMGWVSKDEFRGPADKWRDADEFVRKGEEDLPIVRERLRDTTRKLTDLEKRLSEQDAQYRREISGLERMTTVALTRQREQIEASYAAAQRQAVEVGDVARFDQLRRDEGEALQRLDQQAWQARNPQPQRCPIGLPPPEGPIVDSWKQQNPWFLHNPEMNQVAQMAHVRIGRENPNLPLQDNLAQVTAYMRQRYPEAFPGQTQQRPASMSVEGGSRVPANGGARRRGAGDLPADARTQGERFIKQGLFKDMSEYANEYWSQEA